MVTILILWSLGLISQHILQKRHHTQGLRVAQGTQNGQIEIALMKDIFPIK